MGRALMGGARTGEMAALIGPAGLLAALAAAGYQKDDIPRLGRLVLEHLRPAIGGRSWRSSCERHRCCSRSSRFAASVPPADLPQPLCHPVAGQVVAQGKVGARHSSSQRRRAPVRVTGTRAWAPWNSAGGSAIPWVRPVVAAPCPPELA